MPVTICILINNNHLKYIYKIQNVNLYKIVIILLNFYSTVTDLARLRG